MAHVFRFGSAKLAGAGLSNRLCKVPQNYNVLSAAWIRSKANRTDLVPRPKPFPYWRRRLGAWEEITDPIMYRFDENTKILTVDGPPAMGKAAFAKELAEKLDMLYMPPPSFDDIFVSVNGGVDMRSFNETFKYENNQFVDTELFLKKPHHKCVSVFQCLFFSMRLDQYLNALLHLLSTGQGVVLCRSVYSDEVFRKLLFQCGYISKEAHIGINSIAQNALRKIPRPHLIIYLDAPPNVVKDNILRRNIPYEVESKVLTTEYLAKMEILYKEYLKKMDSHSHILAYDWTNKTDLDFVVHDIESIKYTYTNESEKLGDWIFSQIYEILGLRTACQGKQAFFNRLQPGRGILPDEFYNHSNEVHELNEALEQIPDFQYHPGYHPEYNKGLLFKMKQEPIRSLIRKRVRDFDHRDSSMV